MGLTRRFRGFEPEWKSGNVFGGSEQRVIPGFELTTLSGVENVAGAGPAGPTNWRIAQMAEHGWPVDGILELSGPDGTQYLPVVAGKIVDMTNMVEQVAKAIEAHLEAVLPSVYVPTIDYQLAARAAIAAMREPTEAMVEFGDAVRGNHADYSGGNGTSNVFRGMIDEALK